MRRENVPVVEEREKMSHSEICPVCGGSGKLPADTKTTSASEKQCHGCGGLGWITVKDEYPQYPYSSPIELPSKPYDINDPHCYDPCAGCSNNPAVNPHASGVCGCTLPYMNRMT